MLAWTLSGLTLPFRTSKGVASGKESGERTGPISKRIDCPLASSSDEGLPLLDLGEAAPMSRRWVALIARGSYE